MSLYSKREAGGCYSTYVNWSAGRALMSRLPFSHMKLRSVRSIEDTAIGLRR